MTATEKFAFDQPILGRLIAPCNECVKSTRHKKKKKHSDQGNTAPRTQGQVVQSAPADT